MVAALTRASAIDLTVVAGLGPASRELPSRRRERAWVRGAQAGSHEAMEALFRAHWGRAHRAAYLIVHDAAASEDIAQEAFLAAIRALHRFDRRRPFGPWLHRIVVNRAIDWSRARQLRREVSEPHERAAPPASPSAWSDEVVAALGALDPDQRAAVVLRHLLEYTPGEIAELLEIPRGTVNSRLRRALDCLAEELDPRRRSREALVVRGSPARQASFDAAAPGRRSRAACLAHGRGRPLRAARHAPAPARPEGCSGAGHGRAAARPGAHPGGGQGGRLDRRGGEPRPRGHPLGAGLAARRGPPAGGGRERPLDRRGRRRPAPARQLRRCELVPRRPVRDCRRGQAAHRTGTRRGRALDPCRARSSGRAALVTGRFRVAYRSGRDLFIAIADNSDNWLLDRAVGSTPPAWRPGQPDNRQVLAYARGRRVHIVRVDPAVGPRPVLGRTPLGPVPRELWWSADGRRLSAVSERSVRTYTARGRLLRQARLPRGLRASGSALAPGGRRLALIAAAPGARSDELLLVRTDRAAPPKRRLGGFGPLEGLTWSIDGRVLVTGLPQADQWLFLRLRGKGGLVSVKGISSKFRGGRPASSGAFPRPAGWCYPQAPEPVATSFPPCSAGAAP